MRRTELLEPVEIEENLTVIFENDTYKIGYREMDSPNNPREEMDSLLTFIMSHNRYDFSDTKFLTQYDSNWESAFKRHIILNHSEEILNQPNIPKNFRNFLDNFQVSDSLHAFDSQISNFISKNVIYQVISMYDHSGQTLIQGNHSGWDSGIIGYFYVTKQKLFEELQIKRLSAARRQKILDSYFKSEFELLNAYVEGSLFEITITETHPDSLLTHTWVEYDYLTSEEECVKIINEMSKRFKD